MGFFYPAVEKLKDVSSNAEWFRSIGIPAPELSTWLSAGMEILGVILLALGLFTRIIAVPLIFLMVVAIFSVHIDHGFVAAKDGFEINLYYIIMLFTLVVYGPGKYSLDRLIFKNKSNPVLLQN